MSPITSHYPAQTVAALAVVIALFIISWNGDQTISPPQSTSQTAAFTVVNRKSVIPISPDGNQRTRQFLAWAQSKYAYFCIAHLDKYGNIVSMEVDTCWELKDAELDKIAELLRLKKLCFNAASLSDVGLRRLEEMHDLSSVTLTQFDKLIVTSNAFERLKTRRPDLKIITW